MFFSRISTYADSLAAVRDSISLYMQKIENVGINKEKLEFNGIYDAATVVKRIETIENSYRTANFEMCWYYFTEEISQYYGQLISYGLYRKCISHELPYVKNAELFSCQREEPERLLEKELNRQNKCELYLLFWGMVLSPNRGQYYDTLIKKTKHDPFINFYINHRSPINESDYQRNVFVNYDTILIELNMMEDMYKERFYRLADFQIMGLRSSIIKKYRTYLSLKKNKPKDERIDKLFDILTSNSIEHFIEDYFRYFKDGQKGGMMEEIRTFVHNNTKK